MSDATKTPPDGAGSDQGETKTPPASGAKTPPAEDGKKKSLFYYGHEGRYASAKPEIEHPRKGLGFGDTMSLTAAEFKKLPEALREALIPADKWPDFVASLKKRNILGKAAIVPGVDK